MPPIVDFLPVATGAGANVDTQGNFAGSGYQQTGMVSGISLSRQFNKVWRQASFWASVLAWFVSNQLGGINVLDDGDLTGKITLFTNAVAATAGTAVGPAEIDVTFSTGNINFDCSLGSQIAPMFVVKNATGSNSSASISGQRNGQRITIVWQQDGVGSRLFTPPPAVPMSPVNMNPNAISWQTFIVTSLGIFADSDLSSNV